MSNSIKSSGTQLFHVALYERALHREYFSVRKRLVVGPPDRLVECWALDGGHVLRLSTDAFHCTEVFLAPGLKLPSEGLLHSGACVTEHEHEHTFLRAGAKYQNTTQIEPLSEHTYAEEYEGYAADARSRMRERGHAVLMHEWADPAGQCLSTVFVQVARHQIDVQAFHLLAGGGLCVQSLSSLEL